MELGIKGKIAIVTGGSSGVGKAVAMGLAAEGAEVAICGREPDKLKEAAKEIKKISGKEPLAVVADVRKIEDIKSFVAQVKQHYGRVDILVNNAGATTPGSIDEVSDDTWLNSIQTKVMGFMRFIREVLPGMQQQKSGRIINIVGMLARNPGPGAIAAGVVNAANLNLTKGIADQAIKYNVLVNTVCIGRVDTPMIERQLRGKAAAQGISYEKAKADWSSGVPIGRLGKPEEIANVVVFLASEKASFVAGTSIGVDGGIARYI